MGAVKSAPMDLASRAGANWRDWNWKRGAALLLSALAHVLVVVLLLSGLLHPDDLPVPPTVTVELVPEAAKPKPEPAKPEPPKPEPPKPAPPKPAPPKPEPVKPSSPPPQVEKPPPPPKPWWEMPEKPVLQPGKLAKTSNAVTRPMGVGAPADDPDNVGDATQSERDFILGQILPLWKRPPVNLPPDVVVNLRVLVLADGSLGSPFSAGRPWNPGVAIEHYNQLPPGDPVLMTLVSLYTALRLAQPLKLPPELKAKAPFAAVLDFRLADAP